jgi:tRNA pseudouridine38-40 synthase
MTRRVFITVEYDGAPFVGWQRQDNGITVQQKLEEAAFAFTGENIPVQGAGRTDSGVHALGQVAHLDVPEKFAPNRVMEALNAHLSHTAISVLDAYEVPDDAHARFRLLDGVIYIVSCPAASRLRLMLAVSGITNIRLMPMRCRLVPIC